MSTINLMILGILKFKSQNAYEIVKVVEEYKIDKWIKITAPSIYQNIKKMMNKGYLSGVKEKDGEMPEKTVYSLTNEGENYFLSLMEKYSSCPDKAFENFLPFISNLLHINREQGIKMLENLRKRFEVEKEEIDFFLNKLPSDPSLYDKTILKFYEKTINAKLEWLDELFFEYKEKGYGDPFDK